MKHDLKFSAILSLGYNLGFAGKLKQILRHKLITHIFQKRFPRKLHSNRKKTTDLNLILHTKNKSRVMVDPHIKAKTRTLVEENNGVDLCGFFIREIIYQFHCIKIQNLHS